jgi:hypothetical protein
VWAFAEILTGQGDPGHPTFCSRPSSRLAGDPDRLRGAFVRALRVLWCLAMPVAGFFVAVGEPTVTVLLGEAGGARG